MERGASGSAGAELERAAGELREALVAREREWPRRGQAWERMGACLDRFSGEVGACASAADAGVGTTRRERAVVIAGPMKSGTTLLTALLDGHPDLLALPGDTWMRRWLGDGECPARDGAGAVRFWLQRVIVPTGQAPFWLLGDDPWAYVRFAGGVLGAWRAMGGDPLATFLAGAEALRAALGMGAGARLVEKTPANERHVGAILAALPGVSFVHVLRHPLSIAAALKKLAREREWAWDASECAGDIAESFALAVHWRGELGESRYRVVRYESLVERTEEEMRGLAAWLGVEFHRSMLVPTVFGRPASSNSMFADRRGRGEMVRERAGEAEARWRGALEDAEIELVRGATRGVARGFGYEL